MPQLQAVECSILYGPAYPCLMMFQCYFLIEGRPLCYSVTNYCVMCDFVCVVPSRDFRSESKEANR